MHTAVFVFEGRSNCFQGSTSLPGFAAVFVCFHRQQWLHIHISTTFVQHGSRLIPLGTQCHGIFLHIWVVHRGFSCKVNTQSPHWGFWWSCEPRWPAPWGYEKDQYWAGCRTSCEAGAVNPTDPIVPWDEFWSVQTLNLCIVYLCIRGCLMSA